jgi:hypothetical protein
MKAAHLIFTPQHFLHHIHRACALARLLLLDLGADEHGT